MPPPRPPERPRPRVALALALGLMLGAGGCASRDAGASDVHVEIWPDRVTTGDFNGDGALDVLTWGTPLLDAFISTSFLLYGDGRGDLGPPVALELPGETLHVLAEDLNRDGADDLVVAWRPGVRAVGNIFLFLGGPRGLSEPSTILPSPLFPHQLYVADLDGDGWLDVLLVSSECGGLCALRGRGATFDPELIELGDVGFPDAILDLDGDTRLEIIVDRARIQTLGLGGVADTWSHAIEPAVALAWSSSTLVDVQGDANPELVALSTPYASTLYVVERAARELTVAGAYPMPHRRSRLSVADLNVDGKQDIILGASAGSSTLIAGELRALPDWNIAAAGDFDGDGRPEYVFVVGDEDSFSAIVGLTDIDARGRPTRRPCKYFEHQRPRWPDNRCVSRYARDPKATYDALKRARARRQARTPTPPNYCAHGVSARDDRDCDGYDDRVDLCPDTPEDFDAFEDEDGCPDRDNDGDGVLDAAPPYENSSWTNHDQRDGLDCRNDPEDHDGDQDDDGCPDVQDRDVPDADGDGIRDEDDECPERPENRDGFTDDDGCPDG